MTTLLEAFDSAVQANAHTEAVDDALIQAGRSIAQAIDEITADPEVSATDKTKALYLTPHLISILRELLATPASRKAVGLAAADQKKASRLTLIKQGATKTSQEA